MTNRTITDLAAERARRRGSGLEFDTDLDALDFVLRELDQLIADTDDVLVVDVQTVRQPAVAAYAVLLEVARMRHRNRKETR